MKLFIFSILLIFNWEVLFSQSTTLLDSVSKELIKEKKSEKKIALHSIAANELIGMKNFEASMKHLSEAKRLALKIKNNNLLSNVYKSIADFYYYKEDPTKAIEYCIKALLVINGFKIEERVACYNRLGIIYFEMKEFEKAVDAYQKAIINKQIAEKNNIKLSDGVYNNIALAFTELQIFDSAKYYHHKSLAIRLKQKDNIELGRAYNNLGTLYYTLNQCDSSYYFYNMGLIYRGKAHIIEPSSLVESKINIGKTLICLKKYKEAEKILLNVSPKADKIYGSSLTFRCTEQLMNLYNQTENYKKANYYTQKFYKLKDSMFALETREEAIRLSLSFNYSEKRQHDSLLNIQKEIAAQIKRSKEKEISKQKDREKNIIVISLILAILFMTGIIILIYRTYQNKKKTSEIILKQKEEVENQRDIAQHERFIATEQKEIAEQQRNEIELIHREITDSITYAKRIQSAILPPLKLIKTHIPESFIFYKPKDIVAGDFYWFEVIDNLIFIAAADCTGHGVPGAMVSVVCHNALNRSMREFNLKKPSDILDKTREIVISEFEKSDEDVKDGMDISLCSLNIQTKQLKWAGANNPLWILRNKEILEYKADKQPIGKFSEAKAFTNHEFELQKNDEIYIFTDGFQDQFGGEKGKKYKVSQMRELFLSLNHQSSDEKLKNIDSAFETWKGELEQVDDVCVIGVRI